MKITLDPLLKLFHIFFDERRPLMRLGKRVRTSQVIDVPLGTLLGPSEKVLEGIGKFHPIFNVLLYP